MQEYEKRWKHTGRDTSEADLHGNFVSKLTPLPIDAKYVDFDLPTAMATAREKPTISKCTTLLDMPTLQEKRGIMR